MENKYFRDDRGIVARITKGFVEVLDEKADEWVKVPGNVLDAYELSSATEWDEIDESDLKK